VSLSRGFSTRDHYARNRPLHRSQELPSSLDLKCLSRQDQRRGAAAPKGLADLWSEKCTLYCIHYGEPFRLRRPRVIQGGQRSRFGEVRAGLCHFSITKDWFSTRNQHFLSNAAGRSSHIRLRMRTEAAIRILPTRAANPSKADQSPPAKPSMLDAVTSCQNRISAMPKLSQHLP